MCVLGKIQVIPLLVTEQDIVLCLFLLVVNPGNSGITTTGVYGV